eukprot:Em0004g917a
MLINIVRDERYGRGWYATQPIKPGTEVLREEPQAPHTMYAMPLCVVLWAPMPVEGKASPDTKQLIEDQVLEAMELLGVAYKPSAYDAACKMHHSCEPNCAWSFDGKAMVILAVTDISADKQQIRWYPFQCNISCAENNDKAGAMETALNLVALYRCSLFTHHPAQGLALFRLGKLQKQAALQQDKSGATLTFAIGSLTTAVQALQICFGPDHPLTKEAVLELQEAEEETP